MYKNFIFDMGNVLMDFSPDYILSCYTQDVEDIELLKEVIFESGLWSGLDNGDYDFDSVRDQVLASTSQRLHHVVRDFFSSWYTHKLERTDMKDIIALLKSKGYGIFLCSNAASLFHEYKNNYEVFKYFDHITISADIRISKPNRGIYDAVLKTNSLEASTCLFIDDIKENITGAKHCGIAGYLYNGNAIMFYDYLKNIKVIWFTINTV